MYKIINSNCFEGAFEGILKELKTKYAADTTSKHIVLVPDKYSLTLEKRLMDGLGVEGAIRLQVQSFTRFAARSLKGKIKSCLTPEGSVMLLQKVINDNREHLLCYKVAAYTQGFAGEMYAAITALRNAGVTPESLKNSIDRIRRPSLKNKVTDIALLFEKYLLELTVAHSDSSTRLEYFGSHIAEVENIAYTHVYVTDFYTFTKPQYDIIRGLAEAAASVTVGIVRSRSDDRTAKLNAAEGNRRIYPDNTGRHLLGIAAELGIRAETEEYNFELSTARRRVAEGLYAYSSAGEVRADGYLQLKEYGDVFTEIDEVARCIRELVIEKGLRYNEIAVVTGDIDTYMPVIASAFERFDIPYFIDKKWQFVQQMPVRFLLSALVAADTKKTDDILEFVKNPFFFGGNVTAEDVDCFENECLSKAVEYPLSYDEFRASEEKHSQSTAYTAAAANRVKERLAKVLPHLPKEATAHDYLEIIYGFLNGVHYFDGIGEFAKQQFEMGESPYSKCTEQVEEKLRAILDEIDATLGSVVFIRSDFNRILESMLGTIQLALAPLYIDSVFIGMADESRFDNVRSMFVVGALEGRIPSVGAEACIISTADEEELKNAEIALEPSKLEANRLDLFYLTQILMRPTEQLIVSYPRQLFAEAVTPSYIVDELRHLFTDVTVSRKVMFDAEGTEGAEKLRRYAYRFATPKNAYYELLGSLTNERVTPKEVTEYFDAARELLSADYKKLLDESLDEAAVSAVKDGFKLFLNSKTTSVSQLERFFNCPLQHFFQYGLKLRARQDGTIKTTDTGTFLHDVLEHYFGGIIEGKYDLNISEGDIEKEVRAIIDALVAQPSYAIFSATGKHLSTLNRLAIESLKICKALTTLQLRSKFRPYKVETSFYGGEGQYDPIPFTFTDDKGEEQTVRLIGRIDRIDIFKDALYVVDYKSYKKTFNYKEVFFGTAIQLFVYLSAVIESEGKRPVGAFYLPVTTGYNTESARFRAAGLVTDNISDLVNMDEKLADAFKSDMLPVKTVFNAENELVLASRGNDCAVTAEQFGDVLYYVKELISQAVKEIAGGYIAPRPIKRDGRDSSCDKCDFAGVCPDREGVTERVLSKTEAKHITAVARLLRGGKDD